jgi:glycosyltransferase involved in cell wall biosynthesis
MEPKVTIALPTYNRADKFLRPAIECALSQDWENLEIVVSDNCSTDDTPEVVKSYRDPRLRYFRQDRNIGANNNFNFCVENATGSYFLLFHDDDRIDSDLVSHCMQAVDFATDCGLIRTGTRLIDGEGSVIREVPNTAAGLDYVEFFRGWMHGAFTSYVCSTLFNTALLKDIGGFRSQHGLFQDLMVVAKLIARAGHGDVEAVKASFRRHDENYGNAADLRAWCEDGKELAQTIAAEAPRDGEALYSESMRYLCGTVYGYARRFLANPVERARAYRMIQAEFDDCYPVASYIFNQDIRRRYRKVRGPARRFIRRMLGRQESAPT